MNFFVVLFCSVTFVLVRGQNSPTSRLYLPFRNRQNNQPHPNPQVITNQANVPETQQSAPQNWRDLIIRANNGTGVSSVNDFLNLLVKADGRPVREDDIFSPYETQDGKRVITGGGMLAVSDECSPRNISVRLPLDYSDTQVAYYPECTMVQRCGGCTPTTALSCEPLYKEKLVLKVLRAVYLYPGAMHMQWTGFASVEVERHLSCRAVCTLSPGSCGVLKQFLPHQCKCQCRSFSRCSNEQKWDDNTCSCRCQSERPCCEPEETCAFFYDHRTCQCSLKQSIGAPVNATQEEIDAWMASRNQGDVGSNVNVNVNAFPQPTPTAAEGATTTTTTEVPTSPNPCASRPCPNGFNRRMNAGRCLCVLQMNGIPRRNRRYSQD